VRGVQPSVEVLALFVGQSERFVVIRDAVPELLEQLQPLGGAELE